MSRADPATPSRRRLRRAWPASTSTGCACGSTGLDEAAARTLARLVAERPGARRCCGRPGDAGAGPLRIEVTASAAEQGSADAAGAAHRRRARPRAGTRQVRRPTPGGAPDERVRAQGRARRVHADVPADPGAERDRLPVQPGDDDPHLDPAGAGDAPAGTETSNPLAVTGMPGEEFSFTIAMDANDEIADGSAPAAALAEASGVYSRLAALEMLLYPTGTGRPG